MISDGSAVPQTLFIEGWHPQWNPNGTGNRSSFWTLRKRKKADEIMVWASAKHAGWQPVQGRARVTVTFVYARNYGVDIDNLYARCKGIFDGLVKGGWIVDDKAEWLDPLVRKRVCPGMKGIEITLEPA